MELPINKFDSILNFQRKDILPIIVSSETYIVGNISSSNSIRLEGIIEGEIYSKNKIIVDDAAIINGNIMANNVEISGRVNGNIYCTNKVVLKNGAEVYGTIYSTQFKSEDGSIFNNKLKLLNADVIVNINYLNEEIKPRTNFHESETYNKLISYYTK